MSTPRTRTGCQTCRCDDNQPACSRCQASGHECLRGVIIRFKHTSQSGQSPGHASNLYQWVSDQVWPRTSTSDNLIFLDETESLVRVYEREAQESDVDPGNTPPVITNGESPIFSDDLSIGTLPTLPTSVSQVLARPQTRGSAPSPSKCRRLTTGSQHEISSLSSPITSNQTSLFFLPTISLPEHGASFDLDTSDLDANTLGTPGGGLVDDLSHPEEPNASQVQSSHSNIDPAFDLPTVVQSPIYVDSAIWPLSSLQEAKLMRYFVDRLSTWFDLCDPARHFALVVPQRAAICPPLLYAVFAVSARHLNRISSYDPFAADRYYGKCLNHLKNMMSDESAILDENLLAATVILRFLEEVDVSLSGFDLQSYLVGTKVLITAQDSSPHPPTGLRQAAIWVALRQEIYIAFLNQRIVRWDLGLSNVDRSFSATDDSTWANRILLHCADVINFCFDRDGDHTFARWAAMKEYCEDWRASIPAMFSPIYYEDASPETGSVLPQVWHIGDAHVTGIQHYILCMILLTVYNPSLPRLGPVRRAALQNIDEEIKRHVLMLAGMAVSNCHTPPNMITACMGISMTGERFADHVTQVALLEILVRTEREFAWPTKAAQRSLKEAWGWEVEG